MKPSNISNRLRYILEKRHLRQVDILRLCEPYSKKFGVKIIKSDLSQYVSGKTEPGKFKLALLGMALDVSDAWLMGYDVPMEREKPDDDSPININTITSKERNLIADYRNLDDYGQQLVDMIIDSEKMRCKLHREKEEAKTFPSPSAENDDNITYVAAHGYGVHAIQSDATDKEIKEFIEKHKDPHLGE